MLCFIQHSGSKIETFAVLGMALAAGRLKQSDLPVQKLCTLNTAVLGGYTKKKSRHINCMF